MLVGRWVGVGMQRLGPVCIVIGCLSAGPRPRYGVKVVVVFECLDVPQRIPSNHTWSIIFRWMYGCMTGVPNCLAGPGQGAGDLRAQVLPHWPQVEPLWLATGPGPGGTPHSSYPCCSSCPSCSSTTACTQSWWPPSSTTPWPSTQGIVSTRDPAE